MTPKCVLTCLLVMCVWPAMACAQVVDCGTPDEVYPIECYRDVPPICEDYYYFVYFRPGDYLWENQQIDCCYSPRVEPRAIGDCPLRKPSELEPLAELSLTFDLLLPNCTGEYLPAAAFFGNSSRVHKSDQNLDAIVRQRT